MSAALEVADVFRDGESAFVARYVTEDGQIFVAISRNEQEEGVDGLQGKGK